MKIICNYCGNPFNDTHETCPHCGAPNPGVVRRSGRQPVTIEELKQWYQDRGLPPYKVTRFFIGEDHKGPRAFGIYRDEKTGNFVVYKNKDSGQRAVRYEGTDEAYAVNELYQRLKQEILQQKKANLTKGASGGTKSRARASKPEPKENPISRFIHYSPDNLILAILFLLFKIALLFTLGLFVVVGLFVLLGLLLGFAEDEPERGYYSYENSCYYYYIDEERTWDAGWLRFDGQTLLWSERLLGQSAVPEALRYNSDAKDYFLSEEWSESIGAADVRDSVFWQDTLAGRGGTPGYFTFDDTFYYHLTDHDDDLWYTYDDDADDWARVDYEEVPYDLRHSSRSEDFFYTPTWDPSTQVTDFLDSDSYQDYEDSYSSSTDSGGSSWDDDDDDDYDWGDDDWDDWDSGGTDWDSDW